MGKNVFETTDMLLEEAGEDARVACIGPAGEKLVLFAAAMNDKHRTAGRSALGAVMGSKNLKSIVVKDSKSVEVAKPKEFLEIYKKSRDMLKKHPVTSQRLPTMDEEIPSLAFPHP